MRVNQLSLVIAAAAGGAAVQLVFQACGSVKGSSTPDARADAAASAPIVTEWVTYTPALTSSAAGAPVGNALTTGRWRRVGDSIELRIRTDISGMPTGSGCGDFWEWSLPDGLAIDMNKDLKILGGTGNAFQLGSGNARLQVRYSPNPSRITAEGDADCNVNAMVPFTFSGGGISLAATFPIAGWTVTQ